MEESFKRVILEYLEENRYFERKELENRINEMKDEKEAYFKEEANFYEIFLEEEHDLAKKELREEVEGYEEEIRKNFNEKIFSFYLPKVLNENYILLEFSRNFPEEVFILKGKEAEFFVFIFNFYKNDCMWDIVSREYIEEAKSLLDMKEDMIDKLLEDGVLSVSEDGERFYSNIFIKDRREIFQNSEIENKIFLKTTSLNINKNLKKLKEETDKIQEKIKESNKKIEEAEAKIKESNEKINKTTKSIENTKVDTLALLAIFVAIISIIYGNIFASNNQSIKNVIITNISTVTCIAFILGYIEIFVKDNKMVKKDCFIASSIIIMVLAVIIAILIK